MDDGFTINRLRLPSLLFGLAFVAIAVLALLVEHGGDGFDEPWVAVVGLSAVGLAGVLSVIWSLVRPRPVRR